MEKGKKIISILRTWGSHAVTFPAYSAAWFVGYGVRSYLYLKAAIYQGYIDGSLGGGLTRRDSVIIGGIGLIILWVIL